jgi:hypothetical protein
MTTSTDHLRAASSLKSLKLYAWSYREVGAFHEEVTRLFADDLAAACAPEWLLVEMRRKRDLPSASSPHATGYGRVASAVITTTETSCDSPS